MEIVLPQQKVYDGVPFPLAISPTQSSANLAEYVRAHKPWLEAKLHDSGALLFRGFDVPTASEFSDAVKSFEYEDVTFFAGAAPRTHVVGPVYTANDGPAHIFLHFHNETTYMGDRYAPKTAFFYCEVEPRSMGETPIVLGHIVYERLKLKHFEFIQRLEEHGLIYNKVLPDETDSSSTIGRSWKSSFSTDNKAEAEQKASEVGWKLEWQENTVKVVMGPVPGIKIDKSRGDEERRIWFNHLMAATYNYNDVRNDPRKAVTMGDGTPIPLELVEDCKGILEEECVVIPWKQGDVLMLDNWAVQHARHPYTPPRRVLTAFCK